MNAQQTPKRVEITAAAAALLHKLIAMHGALMFHQSGGCCDGSAPMCYPLNEFKVGGQDILLGIIENCPFWMSVDQFSYWQHTHLTVDVVVGRGAGFSVEAPEGVRFIIRSRLLDDAEAAYFASQPKITGDIYVPENT